MKRYGLSFGPREALDDPALLFTFKLLDLLSDELDDDVITHIRVGFKSLLNALTILLVLLGDVSADQITNGDALNFARLGSSAVLGVRQEGAEAEGNLLSLAAWGSNEHDSGCYN